MTSGFFSGSVVRGLAFRVLLFLSLALLPIGLIAVVQTKQIADQSRASAELSLLALTERASAAERTIIQVAFGAGQALASVVRLIRDDPEACSAFLAEYKDVASYYTLVSFVPADGKVTCSSKEDELDYTNHPVMYKMLEQPVPMAYLIERPSLNNQPVVTVSVPLREEDVLLGFIIMSISGDAFPAFEEPELSMKPGAVLTFNSYGNVLTTEQGWSKAADEMPADVSLAAISSNKGHVFDAKNTRGEDSLYAVIPIVPGAVYAMSVWPESTLILQSTLSSRLSLLMPILMWLASLIVAFWALNRLAITHIRKLGRQMRRFAINRTMPRNTLGPAVPTELVEMEEAFIGMADSILRDEATLEDSLRQKNILLKEVHHRVKNNLQLISSIMNMQIRQAKTADAKLVLQRLQERILSLATVHKSLYQNDDLVRVDAGALLHEIVNQLLSVGLPSGSDVKVVQRYEPIFVDADDAAPLTLLVSEGVTNALKHVSSSTGKKGKIEIQLSYDDADHAKLTIFNSVGDVAPEPGTGLGSRLILAFTRQLNGNVESSNSDEGFLMTVRFPVPMRNKEIYDY